MSGMATRRKETVAGKEKRGVSVSPTSSSTPTERRRSSGATIAKDHGKAPATSSAPGEPRKHVPNYLKPTISSNPDAAKQSAVRGNKPTPTMMRRRSFDRPVQRTTPPFSPKHSASAAVTRPASSSSDRTLKVVKAAKTQPPLLKTTKSMPRTSPSSSSGAKKEAKTGNLKKPTPSRVEEEPEPEPVHAPPSTNESEAEEHESLDLNVEEELAKIESPVDQPPPEKHFAEDKEHIDAENQSPTEHEDENKEALSFVETTVSNDQTPEPVTEATENVEATHEETQVNHVNEAPAEDHENIIQVVQQSQHTDENDQQRIQTANETPAEENEDIQVVDQQSQHTDENDQQRIQPVNEAPSEGETDTTEKIETAGTTVKTTPDETDDDAAVKKEEDGSHHDSEGEKQNAKEEIAQKTDHEEKKPGNVDSDKQGQVGGPSRNKKESQQAYNDVIEETASRLVEKRVNKVRALAGAFETVISLQQPDSS